MSKKYGNINWGKIHRDAMLKAGAYDGRFKPKIIKNKKKENIKKSCRNYKYKTFFMFID